MSIIVHISDTHFGTEVLPVVEALRQTIYDLQPDIVILSGDITQRARISQFKSAVDFMAELPGKTKLVVPGNHDIPLFNVFARFLRPYDNYIKAFGARESLWCDGELGIICYDATDVLHHTRGKLKKHNVLTKLATIRKQLNPNAILMVCAHQPLVTAWAQDADEVLIGCEETANLFSNHSVDLVMSGHVHVPIIGTTHAAFPHLPRHFILSGAGTAISHRVRTGAPNSFNLIRTEIQGIASISIAQYNFDAKQSQFVSLPPLFYKRTPEGWI